MQPTPPNSTTDLLSPETRQQQFLLADYARTGSPQLLHQLQGIHPQHTEQYHRLVRSAFDDALQSAFPIAYELFPDDIWQLILNEFLAARRSTTPQLWRMPFQFLEFAREQHYAERFQMPFLYDLLLFEWLEIDLHTMPDAPMPPATPHGTWQHSALVISPEFVVQQLQYPIHRMPAHAAVAHPGNYPILLFRHPTQGHIQFLQISPQLAQLLELLRSGPHTIAQLASTLSTQLGQPDTSDTTHIQASLVPFFQTLQQKGLLLGFASV